MKETEIVHIAIENLEKNAPVKCLWENQPDKYTDGRLTLHVDKDKITFYTEIKKRGLKIPDDIALIGFGDNTLSSYLDPPLTTVKQSPYIIGKVAAGMLLKQIENPTQNIIPEVRVIETELVLRQSV